MKSEEFVIQTQELSKRYGEVDVLRSLDLAVPKNAIFGFLGPNGAGKSTTMKLLLGLAEPTAGNASLFGLDAVRDSLAIRARIGYLPQQPRFYGQLTARETLRFVAECYYRGPAGTLEARVEEALALVGLEQKADRPVRGFSGGERQRLGLAQAQINEPELLILDEPAAALDPIGRHDVLAIMARLRHRATIFYSTHILDDVQQVSDTVAILNQGQLITQGPIEALLSGDGALVYTVTTKGDPDRTRQRLADQPWITGVDLARHNGTSAWQVRVADEATAEALLLRLLLADEQITVTEFTRKRYQLEEVFIDLIEGDNNGRA
ncbi:MAG: ABC transporter ATP-binding protein [Candidatus Promineifilaceae bacterium]|nr:ABC transporter ATP-binding protein [Candidatus Promineifilaceae bacterium]